MPAPLASVRAAPEEILQPTLRIVDPHHHLWDRRALLARSEPTGHPFDTLLRRSPRYMLDELVADMTAGHDVVATVFVQCGVFYRADGPDAMKPLGEVEFVNGCAAQSASGDYGPIRACAGIVGHADLMQGSGAGAVLDAEIAAGGGRFKGIRHGGAHDPDASVLGPLARTPAGLYAEARFREGFAEVAKRGLSFDAWVLEPQIGMVADLASAFPDTPFVLDHVGTPLGVGAYEGRREERFPAWKAAMAALAERPNVAVKLGGLAMPFPGFAELGDESRPVSSQVLADLWRPYVETTIGLFGPERCMFESNLPVDRWGCDYATLWNAFKRLAAGASADERRALFSGTAERVYRLDLPAAA